VSDYLIKVGGKVRVSEKGERRKERGSEKERGKEKLN
jgi:hypothetical protein